jgi:hypothetical protein
MVRIGDVLSRVILAAAAVAGVVVSVAFVVLGLPEASPAQSVLLELSSLPLSGSVAAGLVLLHRRAERPVGARSRVVLAGGAAAVAFGLVLMGWAYAVGPRDLVHTGQLLVWLGLLAALLVMVRRLPRRRAVRYRILGDEDADGLAHLVDDPRGPSGEAPAAERGTPSL